LNNIANCKPTMKQQTATMKIFEIIEG